MLNKKMENKGFTLIELLVVVAIIAVLTAIVLVSIDTAKKKGADASVKSNLDTIRQTAELFYSDNKVTILMPAFSNNISLNYSQ